MDEFLLLDSDVFLIDCRYQRDAKFPVNRRFLDEIEAQDIRRATTVFNLLEICGILTFNLNRQQLRAFYATFAVHYGVQVVGPQLPERFGHRMIDLLVGRTLGVVLRRVSLGDAFTILTAESTPGATTFITWNARHFIGRSDLVVMTPEEWLHRAATP